MKRNPSLLLGVLCVALLLSASWAAAQNAKPPTQLTYQGFLTDANGVPFGNSAPVNKTVIFRIYNALTGGTLIWSSQQVVTVDKGYFSALLGQGSAVGSEAFSADLTGVFTGSSTVSDRYLELTADGTTIAPRLRFLPAPYALLAKSATELLDPVTGANSLSIASGNLTANGTVTATSFSGSGPNLTSLNGANIASGTIANARTTATSANTGSAVVARDASGNFSAGTVTATGFSGSGASLTSLNASQITSGTLDNARTTATSANTANAIVARDVSGNSYFAGNTGIGGVQQGFYGDSGNIALRAPTGGATYFQTYGGGRTDMFIANNGNVGIGTTGPDWPLTVLSDSGNGLLLRRSDGRYAGLNRGTGNVWIQANNLSLYSGTKYVSFDGDNNWDFSSDRKLKRDIVDAEPMLDRAMKVQVRRYRWKDDAPESKQLLGVIAQEVQPLFPGMVGEFENPETKEKNLTVGYGDFAVIAIKSLQEFKQQHDAEVSKLKTQLADLLLENQKLQAGNLEQDKRLATIEQFIAAQSRTAGVQASPLRGQK